MSKTIPPKRDWMPGAPSLFFLVGEPATGKSTFTKDYLSRVVTRTHVASTDDILERFAIEDGTSYAIAHRTRFKDADREFKQGIIAAAQRGHDIIVDRTNLFPSARRKIITMVESSTKQVYIRRAIVFPNPGDDVLKERLRERFERTGKDVPWAAIEEMRLGYEPPSMNEFHEIKEFVR